MGEGGNPSHFQTDWESVKVFPENYIQQNFADGAESSGDAGWFVMWLKLKIGFEWYVAFNPTVHTVTNTNEASGSSILAQ